MIKNKHLYSYASKTYKKLDYTVVFYWKKTELDGVTNDEPDFGFEAYKISGSSGEGATQTTLYETYEEDDFEISCEFEDSNPQFYGYVKDQCLDLYLTNKNGLTMSLCCVDDFNKILKKIIKVAYKTTEEHESPCMIFTLENN